MTVADLMYELSQMEPEAEIRFASQPSWPFEYSIDSMVVVEDDDAVYPTVYLVEGSQLGYLPGYVKDEIGW